jgi:hypothetical protein
MAADVRNSGSGQGFGDGATSSIGAQSLNTGMNSGILEASGFTAMLISTDGLEANRPQLGQDIDQGNDGMDHPQGHESWTIVDSIALFGEENEADFGRVYAPLAYGFEPTTTGIPPGGKYVYLPWPELEAEYIGRWGNSTGYEPGDWHVSNLTNNSQSGFTNTGDFRQSSDPHGSNSPNDLESSLGVPYGTAITTTLGSPNYPLNVGDFDADGAVDHDDFALWPSVFADGGFDGNVLLAWQRNLGKATLVGGSSTPTPEPSGALIAVGLLAGVLMKRRRL